MSANQEVGVDTNLVEIWTRRDPVRWIAGALAGAFAGVMAALFATLLIKIFGGDVWMALKVPAIPVLGPQALELGLNTQTLMVGFFVHEGLCIALGVIFAHFTGTNSLGALLGVGLTWAAFSWVFIHNLFTPSFRDVFVAEVPNGATFLICIVFGVSLVSVAFFDRMLRAWVR